MTRKERIDICTLLFTFAVLLAAGSCVGYGIAKHVPAEVIQVPGPVGPPGKDGLNGKDGKDCNCDGLRAEAIDYVAKIEARLNKLEAAQCRCKCR